MTVSSTRPASGALVRNLRSEVADRLFERHADDDKAGRPRLSLEHEQALARHLISEALERHATDTLAAGGELLDAATEDTLAQEIFDALFGLGRLQPLLEDESITDIHVQGCDRVFVVRADGTKHEVAPVAESDAALVDLIRMAAARLGRSERRFDAAHPELNLRLPDGSRLFAVMAVSARPTLAIRRHRFPKVLLADLVGLGTLDVELAAFLASAVRARKNIVIGGGTSMGKTTLLRALINEIPSHERLITIEDSLELGVDAFPELHPDVVTLEAREANVEGEGAVPLEHLVRMALRMDPDRVIVGEVRGDEILPMLNAMSQGNDGSMCTVHAHSSAAVFRKLAMYAMQTPQRLPIEATNLLAASAIDLVVHLSREKRSDARGPRFVTSVREVVDADGPLVVSNEIFRPGPTGRAAVGAPPSRPLLVDLVAAGFDAGLTHDLGGGA